jgi:hypothetical protein
MCTNGKEMALENEGVYSQNSPDRRLAQLATFHVVATSFAFRVSTFRECAQAFMTDRDDCASYGEAKGGKLWDKRGGNRHRQRCHVLYSGGY